MTTPELKHFPPYYSYKRSEFNRVVKCKHCNTVSLHEDSHPVKACRHCGISRPVEQDIGAKWIPPETTGWFFNRKTIKDGYWLFVNKGRYARYRT